MLVLIAGLFTFSFHWLIFDTLIKIPLLPLGVWGLYFFLNKKEGRWQTYRKFAWLGFIGNFIFIAWTLLFIPIVQLIYPEDQAATYISNIEHASVIQTHPSAVKETLNKESLLEQLPFMKKANIHSDQWYRDAFIDIELSRSNERFPYQLIDAGSMWGSGIIAITFIEADGKGILITLPNQQHYFRSEKSLLVGVE